MTSTRRQRAAGHSAITALCVLMAVVMFHSAGQSDVHRSVDEALAWIFLGVAMANAASTLYHLTRKERH